MVFGSDSPIAVDHLPSSNFLSFKEESIVMGNEEFQRKNAFRIEGFDHDVPAHAGSRLRRFAYLASKGLQERRDKYPSDLNADAPERSEGHYAASREHIEAIHLESIRQSLASLNADLADAGYPVTYQLAEVEPKLTTGMINHLFREGKL
jgi:hypothetical protein